VSTIPGDVPCAECGTEENLVWFTDPVFWNNVVRWQGDDPYGYAVARWGGDPILCIPCFVRVAEERGFRPTGWRVSPEWPWRREESTP
jgi:hypothetical protein